MSECYYCGCAVDFIHPENNLYKQHKQYGVWDHVYPSCLGGDRVPKEINLVLACDNCNEKKNGKHPIKWAEENDWFDWDQKRADEYIFRIKFAILFLNGFTNPEYLITDKRVPKFAKEIKF